MLPKYTRPEILIMQDMVRWGAGKWIEGLADWKTYFTMTFDLVKLQCNWGDGTWTRVGMGYAKSSWRNFTKTYNVGDYVMVVEKQRFTQNAHIHSLCTGDIGQDVVGVASKKWGFCHASPYNPHLGAGFYVAKYLTKGYDSEVVFSAGLHGTPEYKSKVDAEIQLELIERIKRCRQ